MHTLSKKKSVVCLYTLIVWSQLNFLNYLAASNSLNILYINSKLKHSSSVFKTSISVVFCVGQRMEGYLCADRITEASWDLATMQTSQLFSSAPD